ncbi:hypothetical protein Tco_1441574 [Tanacetum coccineum]
MTPVESPQMISTVKLSLLKKDEYTNLCENGVETEVPPKTAQAILARQKERKAKSILLLAIPDEYQLRFHTIKDAKSLWADFKSMRNQFFLGGEPGEKNISRVSWKKCLASKKMGGLGIGSIFALNVGLLFKWIWRFHTLLTFGSE